MFDKDILRAKNGELYQYLSEFLDSQLNDFLNGVAEDRAIRINTLKTDTRSLLTVLEEKATLQKLAFCDNGFRIVNEKTALSHTLEFFKGCFAFQGASSQIPPLVLDPRPGEKVLDMAASPGSKTTQMAVMMQNRGELVVNDSNLKRMQALNSNTQKTGMLNHIIYYLAGERIGRLFPEYFDKVLLDTPCTGLGTLAGNPEIISWWSCQKLDKLAKIQKQLIISAIKATKAGGEIVYSTCSVAPEENELLINDILDTYPVELLPIKNPGMDTLSQGLDNYKNFKLHPSLKKTKRVWPHKHGMEGFFIARIRKNASYYNKNNPKTVSYIYTVSHTDPAVQGDLQLISESWGINDEVWHEYRFIKTRERIWILNNEIKKIASEGFNNGGLLLAEERLNIWKLSHQAVQFLGDKISKRKISLSAAQINELFYKGLCPAPFDESGYFALCIAARPSAIVYIDGANIKIKLAHPYNLLLP